MGMEKAYAHEVTPRQMKQLEVISDHSVQLLISLAQTFVGSCVANGFPTQLAHAAFASFFLNRFIRMASVAHGITVEEIIAHESETMQISMDVQQQLAAKMTALFVKIASKSHPERN